MGPAVRRRRGPGDRAARPRLPRARPETALGRQNHPSLEHYLPLLYTVGAASEAEAPRFFNPGFDLGSISMRGVLFG
ncbi:hypothetical protein [Nannocystis pusilla]|uniref:hypothetical protein n=1 Tax=Nannocystis pusilla TaxID=889268 RepID=UPI003B7DEB3F